MSFPNKLTIDQQEAQIKTACYLLTGVLPDNQHVIIKQNNESLEDVKFPLSDLGQIKNNELEDEIIKNEGLHLPILDIPLGVRERAQEILNTFGFQAKRIQNPSYKNQVEMNLGR